MILGLYPAIALPDALDIDMSAVLYLERWRRRKWDISPDNFIVDTEDPAIKNFTGDYNVVFIQQIFRKIRFCREDGCYILKKERMEVVIVAHSCHWTRE